jgi:DNA-binding PadR family transcriptional regulator
MQQRRYSRHGHAPSREQFQHSRHSRRGRGGPRARRGDIRAAILALLADRPMHGYEMIKELEERSRGAWSPSAGSIYPTLQLLEDEGLIAGEESDGKRRFTLTEAGTEANAEREGPPPWDEVSTGFDPEVVRLKRSLGQLNHAIAQVFHAADESERKRVRELLDETRRKVYGILAEESPES